MSKIINKYFEVENKETDIFDLKGKKFLTLIGLTEEGQKQTELTIPNQIEHIEDNVFVHCLKLTSLVLPNSLAWPHLWWNCPFSFPYLKKIVLPNNLKQIHLYDFKDGYFLESITIPKSVTRIERQAFQNCFSLQTVTFEEGSQLEWIEEGAFERCLSLQSIVIPDSVKYIARYAFQDCQHLEKVTFAKDSNLGCIADGAFAGCESLESIVFPKSIVDIDNWVFNQGKFNNAFCSNLKSVSFEKGSHLRKIGQYAFAGCQNLDSIVLPNTIKYICIGAFSKCSPNAKYYVSSEKTKQKLLNSNSDIQESQIIFRS